MSEHKIVAALNEAIGHAPSLGAFYDALDRARQDPATATPELARLAKRMGDGRLRLTLGDTPSTPEELAGIVNRSMDEIESGNAEVFESFADSQRATRRQE